MEEAGQILSEVESGTAASASRSPSPLDGAAIPAGAAIVLPQPPPANAAPLDRKKVAFIVALAATAVAHAASAAALILSVVALDSDREPPQQPRKRRRFIEELRYFENLQAGPDHAFKTELRLTKDRFAALLQLVEPHHTYHSTL